MKPIVLATALVTMFWSGSGFISEYPSRLIREQQTLTVDGTPEVWRLQWLHAPQPYCSDDTCPCVGFAYGEVGDLVLVRLRNGVEIDRLRLTPLFTETPGAAVQRIPWDSMEHDVKKRPVAQIMNFADYDHDGSESEFYLQTDAVPCGKSEGIVVGVSQLNGKLHAFGTATHPNKPLYLLKREWDALREASTGSVTVLDWACGDHGAETETDLTLRWSKGGIDGVRREYACPEDGKRGRLVKTSPL